MILVRLPPNVVVVAPTSLERRGSNNHDAGLLFGGPQPRQLEAPGLVAPGLVALCLVARHLEARHLVAPGVVAPASSRAASSRPRRALRRRALPRRVPPRRAPPRRAGVVAPASTSSRRTSSRPASSRRASSRRRLPRRVVPRRALPLGSPPAPNSPPWPAPGRDATLVRHARSSVQTAQSSWLSPDGAARRGRGRQACPLRRTRCWSVVRAGAIGDGEWNRKAPIRGLWGPGQGR